MAKKRTPSRKSSSSSTKRARKAARPARKAASKRAKPRGVDFNPVKKQLRAQIEKLEKQMGGAAARAAAAPADEGAYRTLDRLKALNRELTDMCFPTMVIPPLS